MNYLHIATWLLVTVGGLNWLLIGLGGFMGANWNIVAMLFSSWPMVEWLVYVLVGLAGACGIVAHKKDCNACKPPAAPMA